MDLMAVMQQLKALQMKPNKTPADEARIKELQAALLKPQPKDPNAPPPRSPGPASPALAASGTRSVPAPLPRAAAPPAARPAGSPASAVARARPPAGVPDENAFKLEVRGLSDEGEAEADESDAAKTTHEISDSGLEGAGADDDPHVLTVPDDLEKIDLPEDDEGGVRHEVGEEDLGEAEEGPGDHSLNLKGSFAQEVAKAAVVPASPAASPVKPGGVGTPAGPGGTPAGPYLPRGTPIVPDTHYAKLQANDASVVVQFKDGKLAKGIAGSFLANAPGFTLNQMVPGKPGAPVKLEEALTVRYVRAYNTSASASVPFAPNSPPPLAAQGERARVQLLDGEVLVGVALQRKEGQPFFLVPADPRGNVRRIWISSRAVRKYEKLP